MRATDQTPRRTRNRSGCSEPSRKLPAKASDVVTFTVTNIIGRMLSGRWEENQTYTVDLARASTRSPMTKLIGTHVGERVSIPIDRYQLDVQITKIQRSD